MSMIDEIKRFRDEQDCGFKQASDALSLLVGSFTGDTFTMELDNKSPVVKSLVDAGLITRHPGGPFGSRCSYYRTEKGVEVWMRCQQMPDEHP